MKYFSTCSSYTKLSGYLHSKYESKITVSHIVSLQSSTGWHLKYMYINIYSIFSIAISQSQDANSYKQQEMVRCHLSGCEVHRLTSLFNRHLTKWSHNRRQKGVKCWQGSQVQNTYAGKWKTLKCGNQSTETEVWK